MINKSMLNLIVAENLVNNLNIIQIAIIDLMKCNKEGHNHASAIEDGMRHRKRMFDQLEELYQLMKLN